MAVSTRIEYALRALIEIATEGHISAQKICDAQNLPKKYVEHLLSQLRSANIVKSTPGSLGGYSLSKDASTISFFDIVSAVGDDSYNARCEAGDQRFCLGEDCTLSPFFTKLDNKLNEVLRSFSLEDILGIWERKDK
ncbi:MAG TPA: Rrf2 family transcriptional regulator [Candidatus Cloacimonetes bacterium]|nr:Rrf2 family transcriptional regulator [Candidatus Cloacimonadota bacterium]